MKSAWLLHGYDFVQGPSLRLTLPRLTLHQAGAGVVADSIPDKEFEETVNKAAALGRAVDLAEQAFGAQ